MKLKYLTPFILCITLGLVSAISVAQSTSKIPTEAFSRLPLHKNPRLSPDGKHVAYVHNFIKPEISVLTVYNLDNGKQTFLMKMNNEDVRLRWFDWANDNIVIGGGYFASKRRGIDTTESRLFSLNLNEPDAGPKMLIKGRKSGLVIKGSDHIAQFQDNVIDFLRDDDSHVLVSVDMDKPHEPTVFKVNVYNGNKTRVMRPRDKVRQWLTDQQGNVRLAITNDFESGDSEVKWLDESGAMTTIFSYNAMKEPGVEPLGFGASPHTLFYRAYHEDKKALFKIEIKSGEKTLLLANENYDVDGSLKYSEKNGEVVGYGRKLWDKERLALIKGLDQALPDTNNSLVDFSRDENRYLLYSEQDAIPGAYFFGDRKSQRLEFLLQEYPDIPLGSFNKHQLVTYKASDGVEIEGYLTLPKEGQKPYPLVMHPHGGPSSRDFDGFDVWTSFFVNQGYAVFRPNFRGSSGYGYRFAQSQMKSWGLRMQDDITDATNWLVSEGIVDKSKMCIVGASYGGYATAMAAVKTPNLFQCGISIAGVMDLERVVSESRNYTNNEYVKNQIGDDFSDLAKRSPYQNVAKIKMPMLLIHGEIDRVVDVEHSRSMYSEMESEDKEVRYIELENENHYLTVQRNRHIVFKEMEAFLAKYLQ
ncbi:MAG: alpha/beta hydrolase family protein [Aestuariibacter sp.]